MDGQGNETRYIYDNAGQWLETIDPAGHSTTYTYTPDGLPETVAAAAGSVTHSVYDDFGRVIQTVQAEGALDLTTTYTYTPRQQVENEQYPDGTGAIVERYEYDVYGDVTIFDGSDNVLASSAIGNPYLFTGRRYDPESDNYYYRARTYSHRLGRFLSMDPLGFDAGDYNLYRYVFNNPTNAVDPTGEVAWFLPWLLKASTEAAVDALMQGVVNYYFNPNATTVEEAIAAVDIRQVSWAFVTGFLPGGRWVQSATGAIGDVIINYLDALEDCQEYTPGAALRDFAVSLGVEVIGSYAGDWVAKYGTVAVASGLRRLGFDDAATRVLRGTDTPPPIPSIRGRVTRNVSPDRIRNFWQKRLAEEPVGGWYESWELFTMGGNVIGYEVDGTLAGALAFTQGQKAELPEPALQIMALEVLKDYRRSGIARALIKESQSESTRQGFGGNMYAIVNKSQQPNWRDNVAAMQRLGFEVLSDRESVTLFFSP